MDPENRNIRNTPTPTSDTTAMLALMVVLHGEMGVVTCDMLMNIYPSPRAMTN